MHLKRPDDAHSAGNGADFAVFRREHPGGRQIRRFAGKIQIGAAVKAVHPAVYKRDAVLRAEFLRKAPGGVVIHRREQDIRAQGELQIRRGRDFFVYRHDLRFGRDALQPRGGQRDLIFAEIGNGIQKLAVQVRSTHRIEIAQDQFSDPGAGQMGGDIAAEAPAAEHGGAFIPQGKALYRGAIRHLTPFRRKACVRSSFRRRAPKSAAPRPAIPGRLSGCRAGSRSAFFRGYPPPRGRAWRGA